MLTLSDKKALKSIAKELKLKLKTWTQNVFHRAKPTNAKTYGQHEPSPTPIPLHEPSQPQSEQITTPQDAPEQPQRRFTDRIIITFPPCPPVMPSEWLEIIPVQDDESEIEVVFTWGSMTPMTPLIDQESDDEQQDESDETLQTLQTLQCARGVLESMQTEEEKEREYYVPKLRLGEYHPLRFISHLPTFRKHYSHLIIEDGDDE